MPDRILVRGRIVLIVAASVDSELDTVDPATVDPLGITIRIVIA